MRQDPINAGTPVIMITAKGDADVSWLSGADGYLNKPFTEPELKEKIAEVVALRADAVPAGT